MEKYTVTAEGWLEDGAGNGAYRLVGDTVTFLPVQVSYLGHIVAPFVEKPEPVKGKVAAKAND